MPYSTLAKNLMLDALRGTNPTAPITHVGAFDSATLPAVTSVASTDIFTSTAHGMSAGDIVVFTALTGGAGLVLNKPYFVIATNLAANTFMVSETPGGSTVDHTTNITAATTLKLVEVTGGSPAYARKAIAFNAAAGATMDDSTNGAVLDIPAGVTVDWLGLWSAVTAGTLQVIDDVTPESFGAQGTYTVTDADLDLLAA